jgi:putative tributyrin esterase
MALAHLHYFSESLGVNTSLHALLPEAPSTSRIGMGGAEEKSAYPVIYLLHGWSDDDSIWLRRTSIERYVADLGVIVIMPRVELSYYQNMASGMRFWDLISEELPRLVRGWFPVSTRREDTFAAGLSMGGYGAFRLGLDQPGRFAAVASLSGALDIVDMARGDFARESSRTEKMAAIWGEAAAALDEKADLFALGRERAAEGNCPRLYQCCGTEDFLYRTNQRFKKFADQAGLPLTYEEGPGNHNWAYWDVQIQRVLQFFFPSH